jgi:hypothetical protein
MYIQQANPNLSQKDVHARVSGILLKGQGKRVISMFESADKQITSQMADVFKLDDQALKDVSESILEETKQQLTTGVRKPGGGVGVMPSRGAYGLPTSTYRRTMEQAAGTRGKTLDEFGAQRLPTVEEIESPLQKGRVDLSGFEAAPTLAEMKNSLIKTVIDPEATADDRKAAANQLARIAAAEDIGKKDKDKDIKESDVRSNFRILDATIKRQYAGPGDLVRYTDPETGEVSLELSNDVNPKVRQQINDARRTAVNEYIQEHYAQSGSVSPAVRRVAAAFLGTEPAAPKPTGAPPGQRPSTEQLRADAKAKIQQNPALAARVRKAFKDATGEDL